jgi:hypothetical protein
MLLASTSFLTSAIAIDSQPLLLARVLHFPHPHHHTRSPILWWPLPTHPTRRVAHMANLAAKAPTTLSSQRPNPPPLQTSAKSHPYLYPPPQ